MCVPWWKRHANAYCDIDRRGGKALETSCDPVCLPVVMSDSFDVALCVLMHSGVLNDHWKQIKFLSHRILR